MQKSFIILMLYVLAGCSTYVTDNKNKEVSIVQDTVVQCNNVKHIYRVTVVYPDSSYSFGLDSLTAATWGLLELDTTKEWIDKYCEGNIVFIHNAKLFFEETVYMIQLRNGELIDSGWYHL